MHVLHMTQFLCKFGLLSLQAMTWKAHCLSFFVRNWVRLFPRVSQGWWPVCSELSLPWWYLFNHLSGLNAVMILQSATRSDEGHRTNNVVRILRSVYLRDSAFHDANDEIYKNVRIRSDGIFYNFNILWGCEDVQLNLPWWYHFNHLSGLNAVMILQSATRSDEGRRGDNLILVTSTSSNLRAKKSVLHFFDTSSTYEVFAEHRLTRRVGHS